MFYHTRDVETATFLHVKRVVSKQFARFGLGLCHFELKGHDIFKRLGNTLRLFIYHWKDHRASTSSAPLSPISYPQIPSYMKPKGHTLFGLFFLPSERRGHMVGVTHTRADYGRYISSPQLRSIERCPRIRPLHCLYQ